MTHVMPAALAATFLSAGGMAAGADGPGWVESSNENAQVVLELLAEFNPEGASGLGVDGLDEAIIDYRPGLYERNRAASEAVLAELRERLAAEQGPRVRQDLEILIQSVEDGLRSAQLTREHLLPYYTTSVSSCSAAYARSWIRRCLVNAIRLPLCACRSTRGDGVRRSR